MAAPVVQKPWLHRHKVGGGLLFLAVWTQFPDRLIVVFAAAVVGATGCGTLAGLCALGLGRTAYYVLREAEPAERIEMLLQGATIPSIVLALCFLLVACQRTRWWETLRLALRVDRSQHEEETQPWEE